MKVVLEVKVTRTDTLLASWVCAVQISATPDLGSFGTGQVTSVSAGPCEAAR